MCGTSDGCHQGCAPARSAMSPCRLTLPNGLFYNSPQMARMQPIAKHKLRASRDDGLRFPEMRSLDYRLNTCSEYHYTLGHAQSPL